LPARTDKETDLWQVSPKFQNVSAAFFSAQGWRRPVAGSLDQFQNDPYWRDLVSSTNNSMATTVPVLVQATKRLDWSRCKTPGASVDSKKIDAFIGELYIAPNIVAQPQ